jgi:hypothetical protein
MIHHPLHGPRQYTKCQSFQCLVESRTRAEGAWRWGHYATFQSEQYRPGEEPHAQKWDFN